MTIQSMTGFARVSAQFGAYSWTWEIRSVNGKGLDVRCRIPSGFDPLDVPVRNRIAQSLARGNVSASLNVNHAQSHQGYRVNHDLLTQYIDVMKTLKAEVPEAESPRMDGLMALRGVIEPIEEDESEEEREACHKAILDSLNDVLADLCENRAREGERMAKVLSSHIDDIENLCVRAEACAATQPEKIRERLVRQLKDVMEDLPNLDADRISQEAAILMTKADVREELDRLRAHISAARDLLKGGSPCGRKLDFLCQEFNREANTLCSKAQDVELTRIGLDFKAVIDQFREQVQNIE